MSRTLLGAFATCIERQCKRVVFRIVTGGSTDFQIFSVSGAVCWFMQLSVSCMNFYGFFSSIYRFGFKFKSEFGL